MIAIALLFFMAVYLWALLLALTKPPGIWKIFWLALVLSPLLYKVWDIPLGYYEYQKICKAEAGFKVNVPNPAPARIIRLEGRRFGKPYAEDYLEERPSLEQIEAQDPEITYSRPVAYARYERDAAGKVKSTLIDKVGRVKGETTVLEAGTSKAEYILSHELLYPSLRSTLERYALRRADGLVIGSSTSVHYMWSNPANTLFAQAFKVSSCGASLMDEEKLVDLIAARVKAKGPTK